MTRAFVAVILLIAAVYTVSWSIPRISILYYPNSYFLTREDLSDVKSFEELSDRLKRHFEQNRVVFQKIFVNFAGEKLTLNENEYFALYIASSIGNLGAIGRKRDKNLKKIDGPQSILWSWATQTIRLKQRPRTILLNLFGLHRLCSDVTILQRLHTFF